MAYIKYCDYINGHDDTGDGSAGNPYKTITRASTGLTGSKTTNLTYYYDSDNYCYVRVYQNVS